MINFKKNNLSPVAAPTEEQLAEKEAAGLGVEVVEELIEEEKAFRQGTLSVLDLISPAAMQINPDFCVLARNLFVLCLLLVTRAILAWAGSHQL
jgi:hypothetical protein